MLYHHSDSCQIKNLNEVYSKYFGNRLGIFVEIGAHDGKSWSNTWGLANAGWEGIYAEPIEEQFKKCQENHIDNQVVVLNCAVTSYNGNCKLFLGENPTIDDETAILCPWGEQYNLDKFIYVECCTLDHIFDSFEYGRGDMDLVVIDVEGGELHVLNGFTIDAYRPKMMIIETHDGNEDTKRSFHAEAINKIMDLAGYIIAQKDGLNTIYVDGEIYDD